MGCSTSKSSSKRRSDAILICTEVSGTLTCKVVFLGNANVGKSSIISRFISHSFDSERATLSADYLCETVTVGGKNVKMTIWDTAGQERYRTVTNSYYRGADAYVIVYDSTDIESYNSVVHWLEEISRKGEEGAKILLLGNKSDLASRASIPIHSAMSFAEKNGMTFLPVSAKDGSNIIDTFVLLANSRIEKATEAVLNQI